MLKALLTFILTSSLITSNGIPSNNNIVFENPSSFNFNNILNIEIPPTLKNQAQPAPEIKALSALAIDLETGSIIYEKASQKERPIASITKLMTAIIILEENDLNEVAVVSEAATQVAGVKIWLYAGEKISVRDLLKGALIASGNDAAYTLAEHNSNSIPIFVKKMNQKSQLLGLTKTNFSNPMGFDDLNNYSSARDLAILATYALKKPFIRDTVKISATEIYNASGKTKHQLASTNDLLKDEYLQVRGIKTGNTDAAGLCLVALIEVANGNEIITIVLNSPARFTETKALATWALDNYIWP